MSFNLPSAQAANVFTAVAQSVTGIGQLIGAKEETDMGNYNAAIEKQKAEAERTSQRLNEFQKRKILKSEIGKQVAATGASGFTFYGSPVAIMQASLANAELDIDIDRYNSEIAARGYTSQAAMEKYEAAQRARRQYAGAATSFFEATSRTIKLNPKTDKLGTTTPMKPTSVTPFNP